MRTVKYLLPLLPFTAFIVYECIKVIPMAFANYANYRWVAVGLIAFFAINMFAKKNMSFIKTFTHELSHALICLLFNRKIISFNVRTQDGVVWHMSGRSSLDPFISLAPYCLPYFTFFMLLIWSLVATREMMDTGALYGIDIIIGFTLGLHISCFYEQTGNHQTDINQYPRLFSYIFIWTFRLFNLLIILLTFIPDGKSPLKIWGALWFMLKSLWYLVVSWFQ